MTGTEARGRESVLIRNRRKMDGVVDFPVSATECGEWMALTGSEGGFLGSGLVESYYSGSKSSTTSSSTCSNSTATGISKGNPNEQTATVQQQQ